ncbi:MAG TPA: TetR/AcrR family transcriptional regulator [Spirochaetota bacterium]|nr:TetR/AcrR family transcriptional regulator [Spirochaetota bacterium]HPI88908.1 TetR/AcrR family transcriptional regulator [Spirochaetota bacterium]HPR46615.1 TetR/AcrR family transcriptional regulator [Spirochaetota bacterium]
MKQKIDNKTILETALSLFSRYGYRKTTLEEIGAELGMTKGNLYIYVKDKRDLYVQTVSYALERWQQRVRDAIEEATGPRERLLVMCRKAVEYLSEDREFCEVLKMDPDIFPMFPASDPYEEINERSMAMIREILRDGIKKKEFRPVDLDKVASVIFSIYKMFIIRTYIKTDEQFLQELFEDTLDLVTRGLYTA